MRMLILFMTIQFSLFGQNPFEGKWITIDDNTNKPKSVVELKLVNGKLEGTVVKLYPGPGVSDDKLCDKCTDYRKNKKILGMKILTGLYRSGEEYKGGEIIDPENGKIYSCKMWLDEDDKNKLNLRGYLGPFYRTQQWVRVKS
jgi:uncharacterized protein (DUF2147 family)